MRTGPTSGPGEVTIGTEIDPDTPMPRLDAARRECPLIRIRAYNERCRIAEAVVMRRRASDRRAVEHRLFRRADNPEIERDLTMIRIIAALF
jgi:hypothetical protein